MPFPEHIQTDRLVLRRWRSDEHLDALAAVNADPAAVTYLNDGIPYLREESARQSDRFAAQWDQHGFGLYATELRPQTAGGPPQTRSAPTGATIGFVGVTHPSWFPAYATEVEAGWRLHPSHWGHGYATEAAQACITAAWEHLDLNRIIAIIDPATPHRSRSPNASA
jgi:RimJ/RimL family protein N-acetyltransferase